MVPKEKRLNKNEISKVMTVGKRLRSELFDVKATISDGLPKIGIIISKKVNKKAVVRNKIRRKIKHWFINSYEKNYDLVFIIKSDEIKDLSAEELKLKINSIMN